MRSKRLLLSGVGGSRRSCALAAAIFLLLFACCAGEEPRIAGEDPLERVMLVEDELEAIEAWVTSDQKADLLLRFDTGDDIEIVPPALAESMKNAADHLKRGNIAVLEKVAPLLRPSGAVALGRAAGLYDRVVWVMPVMTSLGSMPLDGFKTFLITKRGYNPLDLTDLRQEGKYITGTLGGVPLTITNIADLSLEGESTIIDIDLSYFTGMAGGPIGYGAGTAFALEFLRELRSKRIGTRLVTITLSNTKRAVPIDFRYLGGVVSEALEDPTALGQSPPDKLSISAEGERALFEERYAAADSIYRILVETNPLEPGFHYFLALTSGLEGNAEDCAAHLDEAYRLDPVYVQGLFQIANALASSGGLSTAEELLSRSAIRNAFEDYELSYGTGLMYVVGEAPQRALPLLQSAAQIRQDDFRLQNLIYTTSRDVGDEDGMIAALERLAEISPETVNQRMPWVYRELGVLYEKRGDRQSAGRMYRQYLEAVPSDSTAAELRAKIRGFSKL